MKNLTVEEIGRMLNGVSEKEKENATSVTDFIKALQKEIATTKEEIKKDEQLGMLHEMLKKYSGEDEVISSLDIVERIKSRPVERMFMSGFKGLDDILNGFRPQQLIVLSAATKSGKTSFCVDLTSRMKEINPLWLPFEESSEELIQKFLDRNEMPPLFYTPSRMAGNTLLWVEKKIIEAKAKYQSEIVFIDHLHFIVPFSQERQDLAIGQCMRELKRMAKTWGVVIVLIAHLKKTKMDTQPDLEDLRDSSFIAQEADTVMMLWRETTRENGEVTITNNVNLSVQANRRTGKTGNVKMEYKDGHFYEKDLEIKSTDSEEEKFKKNTQKALSAWNKR
jgi:replicative DNA helicase